MLSRSHAVSCTLTPGGPAMRFRFSLKWALVATVYVAIAAAAFSHGMPLYADLLWILSLIAFGYAVLLIVYARSAQQARAAGFAVLALCFLCCAYMVPDSVPTSR